MTDHIVSSFDEELQRLAGRIAEMGGLAEKQVAEAVTALNRGDIPLAKSVIESDKRLDDMQREIEDQAIILIARRQPMASDLREIIAAMRTSSDLERVGDLAKNIAKRVVAMDGGHHFKAFILGVENVSELALGQLQRVLDAYTGKNMALAEEVRMRDDEIDALYTSLFRQLLTYMMEDPRNITLCTHLLFCAKNIERIGDHATNIAETVYYVKTGEQFEEERQKADETSLLSHEDISQPE
ncbi:phosphate signaling complex protein PhoU [Coralliovum pocilloporae]|uniref:phosphate signaling complex protein PhoU n=1 Tax=Coralliovum pocilloporae TaxID=3066369 RepID=UPI00330775DB